MADTAPRLLREGAGVTPQVAQTGHFIVDNAPGLQESAPAHNNAKSQEEAEDVAQHPGEDVDKILFSREYPVQLKAAHQEKSRQSEGRTKNEQENRIHVQILEKSSTPHFSRSRQRHSQAVPWEGFYQNRPSISTDKEGEFQKGWND